MSIVEKALQRAGRKLADAGTLSLPGPDGEQASLRPAPAQESVAARIETTRRSSVSAWPDRSVIIDMDRLREIGMTAPDDVAPMLNDEIRRIKRPLLANAARDGLTAVENGNLIMIASSIAGEGKTFTTLNLALSMARERDRTVLLVDADVAKRHLTQVFGLQDTPGLTDLLADENLDVGRVIFRTDLDGLRVLPAGYGDPNATELLASNRMRQVTRELAQRYADRLIVFDSPPILMASEGPALASMVGQIVMVVQAEKTPRQAVHEAITMLDPDKPINLVLNKRLSSSIGHSRYYVGYGTSITKYGRRYSRE